MLDPGKLALYVRYYPVAVLFLALAVAVIFRWRVSARIGLALAAAGILFFIADRVRGFQLAAGGVDFEYHWQAGRDWLSNLNPYARTHKVLYPPHAIPLFGLSALSSFESARIGMLVFNLIGATLLVPVALLALRALRRDSRPDSVPAGPDDELSRGQLAILTAVGVVCLPVYFSLTLGQPTIYIALAALGAVIAQGRGRPILAGICLTVAAVKPQTAAPLLLLFLRRRDVPTWVTFVGLVVGLSLLSSPPGELGERTRDMLRNAATLVQPGQVNDFSDESSQAHSLLGLDRLLYCLGLHVRPWVRVGQVGLVALAGLWLGLQVVRERVSRPAAAALVFTGALLFLYHRTYDLTLLALPLLYVANVAVHGQGRQRRWAVVASLAILALLFVHPRLTQVIALRLDQLPVVGAFAQALLMPLFIWLLLLTIACIFVVGRSDRQIATAAPDATARSAGGLLPD